MDKEKFINLTILSGETQQTNGILQYSETTIVRTLVTQILHAWPVNVYTYGISGTVTCRKCFIAAEILVKYIRKTKLSFQNATTCAQMNVQRT